MGKQESYNGYEQEAKQESYKGYEQEAKQESYKGYEQEGKQDSYMGYGQEQETKEDKTRFTSDTDRSKMSSGDNPNAEQNSKEIERLDTTIKEIDEEVKTPDAMRPATGVEKKEGGKGSLEGILATMAVDQSQYSRCPSHPADTRRMFDAPGETQEEISIAELGRKGSSCPRKSANCKNEKNSSA